VVNLMPQPLCPRDILPVLIDGPQDLFGRFPEETVSWTYRDVPIIPTVCDVWLWRNGGVTVGLEQL